MLTKFLSNLQNIKNYLKFLFHLGHKCVQEGTGCGRLHGGMPLQGQWDCPLHMALLEFGRLPNARAVRQKSTKVGGNDWKVEQWIKKIRNRED